MICYNYLYRISLLVFTFFLTGCGESAVDIVSTNTPADTYFSMAVTENSHNHSGARLLFLDFQDETPNPAVIQNNVVISPKLVTGAITLNGDAADWDPALLTTVNGLVQNNYPLSEFIDAVPTDITVGSAWDENYIYFLVQWVDAGHTASTKYKKWIYDGSNWNPKLHSGVTAGAANDSVINLAHTLLGKENEDRVLMMFPVVDSENNFSANGLGCAAYCHTNLNEGSPYQYYTGFGLVAMHTNVAGDRADIWHWKSSRTHPSGYADDKYIDYATGSENGRRSDAGSAAYNNNPLSGSGPDPQYWNTPADGWGYLGDILLDGIAQPFPESPAPGAGNEMPATISTSPSDSRGDVETRASFSGFPDYRWTVEFRRLRNTGNSDDYQFDAGDDAIMPGATAVVPGNDANGANLYAANCESGCHLANGSGNASGSNWSFPRIQRASGSLILKALRNVVPMQSINLTDQQVEDIAAYLQTQGTNNVISNLSVSLTGGATGSNIISSSPAGISCMGDCSFDFVSGGVITLTSSYVSGYSFTGWDYGTCGSSQSCDVTLSVDMTVTATYTENITLHTLTVTANNGGTVSSVPAGIDCGADCTEVYTNGNTIILTAAPDAGYQFDSWTGDVCSGSANSSCSFTINANTSVTANFSLITVATCANGAVIYDTNGTNGYGVQMIINEGIVSNPTDLAFVPGSTTEFLVTAQGGTVYYFNGACTPVNSINISNVGSGGIGVVNGGEQGLLNIEFHPNFTINTNNYVFFYHTSVSSAINSVSRMTVSFSGGNLVLSDPVKIIDFRKVGTAGNHNGGGLVFAPDNTLLASVGDGGSGSATNAQVNTNLLGTVVRIIPRPAGGYDIPAGNMFDPNNPQCTSTSANSAACPEILAMGLRNPYRMSIDGNIVYLGDVGSSYEEINSFDYTGNGLNFGWNTYDGPVNRSGYRDPIIAYRRNNDATSNLFRSEDPDCASDPGCDGNYASVMIGDVYRGALYGGELTGRLLHAEFMDGYMRAVSVNAMGATTDSGMHVIHHDGISAMIEGPDGYIYIATQRGAWGTGDADIVYRLVRPQVFLLRRRMLLDTYR